MSAFHIERRGLFIRSESEDGITEIVDFKLELENSGRTEILAHRLREGGLGNYLHGNMWAELRKTIPGGLIWLQASDEAVIIHVHSIKSTIQLDTSARWNRTSAMLKTFTQIAEDPLHVIMSYDSTESVFLPQNTHTRWHASHAFSELLTAVESRI